MDAKSNNAIASKFENMQSVFNAKLDKLAESNLKAERIADLEKSIQEMNAKIEGSLKTCFEGIETYVKEEMSPIDSRITNI